MIKLAQVVKDIDTYQDTDIAILTGFEGVLSRLIAISLPILLVVFLIMVFTAGFKFTSSEANQDKLAAAKGTFTHAVLGLGLGGLAYLILQLISAITGVNFHKQ